MKKKITNLRKLTLTKEPIAQLGNQSQSKAVGGANTYCAETCNDMSCTVDGTIVYTQYHCTSACPIIIKPHN